MVVAAGAREGQPDIEDCPEEGDGHEGPDHLPVCGLCGAAQQTAQQQTHGGLGHLHHRTGWTGGGWGWMGTGGMRWAGLDEVGGAGWGGQGWMGTRGMR